MTKILFVDDDAIIRRGISSRIDWKANGWELAGTARDAIEALDLIKDNQPDIILTDIKMPGMSGIEMASIAKEYNPNIKFVFISGYKDFEYAQQVLKLNAVDYLTKPLDDVQLVEVLKKAENLYRNEQKVNEIMNEKYPQIKRHYISNLMKENFQHMDNSFFEAFDINMSSGYGIVAFIDMHCSEDIPYDLMRERIDTYCDTLTSVFKGSFFFCMDSLQIFMIYTNSSSKDEAEIFNKLSELEAAIIQFVSSRAGGGNVSFFYGSVMHSMYELYSSYQTAVQKMNTNVDRLVLEARRYIEENYSDCDLSLVKIADHFNINHCYLTSVFKKKFDINLYDYIIRVRMENAAQLIVESDLKNYEIAEATGYKNPQYFSISFKKYYNCTVTQYRQEHKDK